MRLVWPVLLFSGFFGQAQLDGPVLRSSGNGELRSLALSPDDRILAVGIGNEDRGEVELWDLQTRSFLGRLTGHAGPVLALEFSHRGDVLAASARNICEVLPKDREGAWKEVFWTAYRAEVRLWEIATGRLLKRIRGKVLHDRQTAWARYLPEQYVSLAFSPDDRSIALLGPSYVFRTDDWHESLGSGGRVDWWDIGSNSVRLLAGGTLGFPMWLAFGPGKGQLTTVGCSYPFSDGLRIWNSETGKQLSKFGGYKGHIYSAAAAAGRVALLTGWPGTTECRLLDPSGHKIKETTRFRAGKAEVIALSPDAARVAVGGAGQVKICRSDTGEILSLVTIPEGFIRALRFSSDGSHLVVGSFREIRVIDAVTGRKELEIDGFKPSRELDPGLFYRPGDLKAVALQRDGELVVCGGDNGIIWLIDPVTGTWKRVGALPTAITAVAFLDGLRVAACSSDGTLRVWAVNDRTESVRQYPGSGFTHLASWGNMLAAAGAGGSVTVWNVSTEAYLQSWDSKHGTIDGLTYSELTRELLTAGNDGSIRAWDPESGRLLREFAYPKTSVSSRRQVVSFAVSPDRRLLGLTSIDGEVSLLDARTGREIEAKTERTVRCLAFGLDGELLGGNDKGYVLQFSGRHRPVHLKTRGDIPKALAVSTAGRVLVAAGSSYSLCFWDLETGHLIRVMYAPDEERPSGR